MKKDKFMRVMLVLIFLVLAADLLYRMGYIRGNHDKKAMYLPIELVSDKVYNWVFNKHYHKVICTCGNAGKGGSPVEMLTSPPITDGGGAPSGTPEEGEGEKQEQEPGQYKAPEFYKP